MRCESAFHPIPLRFLLWWGFFTPCQPAWFHKVNRTLLPDSVMVDIALYLILQPLLQTEQWVRNDKGLLEQRCLEFMKEMSCRYRFEHSQWWTFTASITRVYETTPGSAFSEVSHGFCQHILALCIINHKTAVPDYCSFECNCETNTCSLTKYFSLRFFPPNS